MRRLISACAALAVFALMSSALAANYFTGTDLYESCRSETERSAQDIQCLAYIEGAAEGSMATQRAMDLIAGQNLHHAFCIPVGANVVQERLVVMKYMREHPEHLNEDAGSIVTLAFVESFPCH